MKSNTVKKSRKLLSTLLVCGTLLGTMSAAALVTVGLDNGHVVYAAAETPDTTSPRVLNIHKYSNTTGAEAATGLEGDAANLDGTNKPLENISFKVEKVNLPAGWAGDTAPAAADYVADASFKAVTTKTDADGLASFALGTANGYYRVTELPNAAVETPAVPFIVTLPLTEDQGTETTSDDTLKYTVDVYPKNDLKDIDLNPVKTLENEPIKTSVKAGEDVTWKLAMDIPAGLYTPETSAGADDAVYAKSLTLTDPIDAASLGKPEDADITGTFVDKAGANQDLVQGTDYTIATTSDDTTHNLVITLTEAGMLKVYEGSKLEFHVTTEVLENKTDGEIVNSFTTKYVGPDGGETETPTPVDPTDPTTPTIKMGNVTVEKVDEAGQPLANAKFKLATDAAGTDFVTKADGTDYELTTDSTGKIDFTGLEVDPTSGVQDYYLVETSAPVGFDKDDTVFSVTAANDDTVDQTVVNKDNQWIPNLPATGDDARLILMVAASTLIVAGGVAVIHYRRKEQANS